MDWEFRTKCSLKPSGISKSWTESWQESCVLFSPDVMHRLWRFVNPSRATNRLIFSLLLLLGVVSVSFVPPLIPWGSSKLHPFPLSPKKATCDVVWQQIQHEPRGLWHTQLWADVEEPQVRDSSGWGGPREKARMSEGKGKVNQVQCLKHLALLLYSLRLSFLCSVCSPWRCWRCVEFWWESLRPQHSFSGFEDFFFSGKEHLSTFSLLCLVTCDSTSSFSKWVQWANLRWNIKASPNQHSCIHWWQKQGRLTRTMCSDVWCIMGSLSNASVVWLCHKFCTGGAFKFSEV